VGEVALKPPGLEAAVAFTNFKNPAFSNQRKRNLVKSEFISAQSERPEG